MASTTRENVIDLTKDPSPPEQDLSSRLPLPNLRSAERPRKRRRIQPAVEEASSAGPSQHSPAQTLQVDLTREEVIEDADELDLTAVESEAGLRQLQEAQMKRHESQQLVQTHQNQLLANSISGQIERPPGPPRLGQLQCVICMESMTNMTATHCGKA